MLTALRGLILLTVPRIFYNILWIAFSRIRLNSLRKILKKTYAAEILYGMLLLIVAVAIVLPGIEPGIRDVGDGLWYSFSLVTTIGLGDIAAVTIPGRILSVILGLYGLVVVALVTSVIVNLYNETRNTAEPEDGKEAGKKTKRRCDHRRFGLREFPHSLLFSLFSIV